VTTIRCGAGTFALGARTYVMGVVNVTPDSFSDGGAFADAGAAIEQGERLLADGADVVDVGGESTRPGAPPVPPADEQARVLPVVRGLVARRVRAISVDTRNASTARACLDAGASWINDVSALRHDPAMIDVARAADAVVLMHMRGDDPRTMQQDVAYADVVAEVRAFLAARVAAAVDGGVEPGRILVDPGIGFGKTLAHNLALSRRLDALRGLGAGVLYGPSRKRFLGELTGIDDAALRDGATVGAVAFAASVRGADVVRVHDAKRAVEALRVVDALARSRPG
jgi:dihydropteroate synthase